MLALGIMNGTSLDGIDYSLVEADAGLKKLRFVGHKAMSIPPLLKKKLILCAQNQSGTYELSLLHFELGELYAKHIALLKKKWRWDIIGVHGQTVHHQGRRATLQIGQPSVIRKSCDSPIYFDFRSADVAMGGEGAPFAPFFQYHLVKNQLNKVIAFHNLGGISNLTVFIKDKVIAFDTGPANRLMDEWLLQKKKINFDKNGQWSAQGIPNPHIVRQFLKHPYFRKKYPKSTGRELFNLDFIKKQGGPAFLKLNLFDQMATLTELTAKSIALSYESLPQCPDQIYFYGGGVLNSYLMDRIQFHLPGTQISRSRDWGWPEEAFESSMVAFLALARHQNITVHRPKVTGAKKAVALGSVYL